MKLESVNLSSVQCVEAHGLAAGDIESEVQAQKLQVGGGTYLNHCVTFNGSASYPASDVVHAIGRSGVSLELAYANAIAAVTSGFIILHVNIYQSPVDVVVCFTTIDPADVTTSGTFSLFTFFKI